MDRRTFEGPMEWEYQDRGPLDATSPFANLSKGKPQQNIFNSPNKFGGNRPNPFASASSSTSPSKPASSLPQNTLFTPRLPQTNNAPAFRNPAFTTPRRPFDDPTVSEVESSPALTEVSDAPTETPEVDRQGDVDMATITPSRIDKNLRYAKGGLHGKRHMPGRGEIARVSREGNALRKRKRHNRDRDAGSLRYHDDYTDAETDDYDSDQSAHPRAKGKGSRKQNKESKGWFMSTFDLINQNPNMPDNLSRWVSFMVNASIASALVYLAWSLWSTVRNDIITANEAARRDIISRALECNNQYMLNECEKKDRPALKAMCDEWDECRIQDPESIMVVKNTAKQVAVVINEFSGTMELKGFLFLFGILFICLGLNRWSAMPSNPPAARPLHTVPPTPAGGHAPQPSAFADTSSQGFMWVPVQTPSHRRHHQIENDDATDTDGTPPSMRPQSIMAPPQTPSRRLYSPTKGGDRGRSPVKMGRTPGRPY